MDPPGECVRGACPVWENPLSYRSSPAGNAFMMAAFAALIPPNLYSLFRYRTSLYTSLITAALVFRLVGHVAKFMLGNIPVSHAYPALYMLGTHWSVTLLASAIFLSLPHVMVIYGHDFQLVSNPFYVNLLFLVLDIFTLVFQSAGIGLASRADNVVELERGMRILLTGLAFQAAGLAAFLGAYRYFQRKLSHRRYILDNRFFAVYSSRRFRYYMINVQVVAALLLLRTAIRIAAFASVTTPLATSQLTSFLLDDALVLVAAIILTVLPVGRVFGITVWRATSPLTSSRRRPNSTTTTAAGSELPLRRRWHRRKPSYPVTKWAISNPHPSPSTRFPSGPGSGAGPGGLPAHPAPYRATTSTTDPPLMSPKNNPVHQRGPSYDLNAASTPHTASSSFMMAASSEDSPGYYYSPTSPPIGWVTSPTTTMEQQHGRRKRKWPRGGGYYSPEPGQQMVDSDAIWN